MGGHQQQGLSTRGVSTQLTARLERLGRGRGSLGLGVKWRLRHDQACRVPAVCLLATDARLIVSRAPYTAVMIIFPRSLLRGKGRPGPRAPGCPGQRGRDWASWRPAVVTYSPRGAQRHGPQSVMPGRVSPVPPVRELGGPGGRRRQREDRVRGEECGIPLRSGRSGGESAGRGQVSQWQSRRRVWGCQGHTVASTVAAALVAQTPTHRTESGRLTHNAREQDKPSPRGWGGDGRRRGHTHGVPATVPGRGPATQKH